MAYFKPKKIPELTEHQIDEITEIIMNRSYPVVTGGNLVTIDLVLVTGSEDAVRDMVKATNNLIRSSTVRHIKPEEAFKKCEEADQYLKNVLTNSGWEETEATEIVGKVSREISSQVKSKLGMGHSKP